MKKFVLSTLLLVFIGMTGYAQDTLKVNKPKPSPKAVYQEGAAKVLVWENKYIVDGKEVSTKNFEINKTYQKDGVKRSSCTFNPIELVDLKAAIEKAIIGEKVKVPTGK